MKKWIPDSFIEWSMIMPLPLAILVAVISYLYFPMYVAPIMIGDIGLTIFIWFIGINRAVT